MTEKELAEIRERLAESKRLADKGDYPHDPRTWSCFISLAGSVPILLAHIDFLNRVIADQCEESAAFAAGFRAAREMAEAAARDWIPDDGFMTLGEAEARKDISHIIAALTPEQYVAQLREAHP